MYPKDACRSDRSRQEVSNEYLLAKIGVDTAENEPLEVWGNYSILFNRVLRHECVSFDFGASVVVGRATAIAAGPRRVSWCPEGPRVLAAEPTGPARAGTPLVLRFSEAVQAGGGLTLS